MNALTIPYDAHRNAPVIIKCYMNGSKLRFSHADTHLERYGDSLTIELPPTAEGTEIQLHLAEGQLTASSGEAWLNLRAGICTHVFTTPTSDFLTVDASATQAGVVKPGKLYVKVKPHGGLPAGEG